jgi:hypothetical protein
MKEKIKELRNYIINNVLLDQNSYYSYSEGIILLKKKSNNIKTAIIMHNKIVDFVNSNPKSINNSDRRDLNWSYTRLIIASRISSISEVNPSENITIVEVNEIKSIKSEKCPELHKLELEEE